MNVNNNNVQLNPQCPLYKWQKRLFSLGETTIFIVIVIHMKAFLV